MESENFILKKEHSDSEVIVIDNDGSKDHKTLKLDILKPKSHAHHKHKRKVKLNKFKENETLIISQKVKVKKQKIQCIVNLSNICKHNEKKMSSMCKHKEKSVSSMCKHKEKNVPSTCKHKEKKVSSMCKHKEKKVSKMCKHKRKKNSNICEHKDKKLSSICKHEERNKISNSKENVKYLGHDRIVPECRRSACRSAVSRKCRALKHDTERNRKKQVSNKTNLLNDLSDISSDIDFYADLSYDKVSSDSFMLYSDDELDTLIKRTKERDRKSLRTSTPIHFESAFEENMTFSRKEIHGSLHSLATLVLETQADLYSPTNPLSP